MSYSSGLFYALIISIVHIMHFTHSLNLPSCRHCRVGFLASWSWKLRPTLHYPLSNRTLYSATLVKYSQGHYIATAKTRVQNVHQFGCLTAGLTPRPWMWTALNQWNVQRQDKTENSEWNYWLCKAYVRFVYPKPPCPFVYVFMKGSSLQDWSRCQSSYITVHDDLASHTLAKSKSLGHVESHIIKLMKRNVICYQLELRKYLTTFRLNALFVIESEEEWTNVLIAMCYWGYMSMEVNGW